MNWSIDDCSIERQSILPGQGFFEPSEDRPALDLADAEWVVIADPDADGLACTALVRATHDGQVTLVPTDPHQLADQLERTAAALPAETPVVICDLAPDEASDLAGLDALVEQAESVAWYDHHEWDDALADQVRAAGVTLAVGDSETVCAADVTAEHLDGVPDHLAELVAVTRDHDLWIRDDPRSDDLADYAHWADPEEYIATVTEHGADLPADVQAVLTERRERKAQLIEKAAARAEMRDIGPWTVAVTYGHCSQNEVAERLRERGADAAVIVKPAGSASIRGTENFERCHEVAEAVGGGGHPRAAGCKPDIYDDPLDYAHHWTTRGAVAKRLILEAFHDLVPEDGADGDDSANVDTEDSPESE
ncbi:DHH family phosphoesterase [Halococcoides cellulosivorans]|uniref:Recombinase RecJ n=1 Tax=Halococcoides cellulosivorans TaxID=1679096 RepID=A0A2R4X2L9_9EURY|nr:recombinase RecJ [Halococcoides cellulosivorans]AWB28038.1 recombinase RecJ [Halococcoides cellulosivorans]